MPFVFRVQMPGQAAYARAIQRFADQIEDWQPFWETYFKPAWYRHITAHYETQGRATGTQWAPLSVRYAMWKQKHWPGLPVGVLSGATRESLTFADDPNAIWEAGQRTLTVGSRVPHATRLQRGTKRMPARPPLRINDQFVDLMAKLMQEYAVHEIRRVGIKP